jgi:hypothetical protein
MSSSYAGTSDGTRGAFSFGVFSNPRLTRIATMSSRQLVAPDAPLGIVIKNGAPAPKPVRFWAYLWAADEEAGDDHWHRHVPSEHAA